MTPQENGLVSELFDRLAKLENAPRDAAAERLIAEGLQRAPHAVYALVQTTLLQDEALKRANARIEELQTQIEPADAAEPEQRPASFLDTMREALGGRGSSLGGAPARGSVPSVRAAAGTAAAAGGAAQDSQADFQPQSQPPPGYPPQMPPGYPSGAAGAPGAPLGGGSFLGTAASAAAGVVGSALLLDGIRSMFGHHHGPEHVHDARHDHVTDVADDDDDAGDVYDADDEYDGDDDDFDGDDNDDV
jgi:uncharacterized protein